MHMPIAVWRPTVRHQDGYLMQRLRRERPKVPYHCWRLQVGLRHALLRVDKVAEFQWVADEENRRVVTHHVPIAFFGIELQRKPARVTRCVRRTLFTADCGEANQHRRLLPN